MKNIELKKLKLINFKGIRNFEADFGLQTIISGANATGKTTLFDAFTWLLFGKDSEDRKDFNIKTLENGIAIPQIDHEVEGTLMVDDTKIVLRRCFREKWTKRRGSEEAEMTGHETLFFWNDVPLQAGEYQQKIDQILTESTFKLITNPLYFNQMKWQDRRNILIVMIGDVDYNELPSYTAISGQLEGKTIDEYRKELAARKKKLRTELDLITARIDEQERSKPKILDWHNIRSQIAILTNNIDIIDLELADAGKAYQSLYQSRADHQKKIGELKLKISDFDFKAMTEFSDKLNLKNRKINELKREVEELNSRKSKSEEHKTEIDRLLKEIKEEQDLLRREWTELKSKKFELNESHTVCPTCLRELDPETITLKIEELRGNFEQEKIHSLEAISRKGKDLGKKIEYLQKSNIYDVNDSDIEAKKKELQEAEAIELISSAAILANNDEYKSIKKELEELEAQSTTDIPENNNRELKMKRADIVYKLDELKKQLATREQLLSCEVRIDELKRQEKTFTQQLADCEKTEFQIQKFIIEKINTVEERINDMFDNIRFKMFDTQINGGIVEVCETLVNGVPWQDANNAAKINSGIEIINVLSLYKEVLAPIWIDNAESICSFTDTPSQMIKLYVSASDEILKLEAAKFKVAELKKSVVYHDL